MITLMSETTPLLIGLHRQRSGTRWELLVATPVRPVCEYPPRMGLIDDASNIIRQRAAREAEMEVERRAAEEARNRPWSDDWTKELAEMLLQSGIPLHPVYIRIGFTSKPKRNNVTEAWYATHDAKYWGEAWPLQGWKNSEIGPEEVNVLLQPSGALWTVYGGHAPSLSPEGAERNSNGWHVSYPGLNAAHTRRFMLVYSAPQAPEPESSADLRSQVGVSVAAAVLAGHKPDGGWLFDPAIADVIRGTRKGPPR